MSNDDDSTTYLPGGAIRVTTASRGATETPQPVPAGPSVRVASGTLRYIHGQPDVQHIGHASGSTAAAAQVGGAGILATARTQSGSPALVVTDSTIVRVDGMDMSCEVAARLGYLRKSASGDYSEAVGGAQEQQANPADTRNQSEEKPQDGPELFDPADEAALAESIESIPQETFDAALIAGVMAVVNSGDEIDLEAAARKLEVSGLVGTEHAQKTARQTFDLFAKQAAKAIAKEGVDQPKIDDFMRYAQTQRRDDYLVALQSLVTQRSTREIRALAVRFMNDTRPQRLGQDSRVTINGIEMLKFDAIRWGLMSERDE